MIIFEGVVGIVRFFLVVGVCFVVVLIWGVYDEFIVFFMKCFYKYLEEGKSVSKVFYLVINVVREIEKFDLEKYWVLFMFFGDDVILDVGEIGGE